MSGRCPHCGFDRGYRKDRWVTTYWPDIDLATGAERSDEPFRYSEAGSSVQGRVVYCQRCGRRVCRTDELAAGWEGEGR